MSKGQSVIIFIIGIFLVISIPTFIQNVNIRNDSVDACERANEGIRKPLYYFLVDAENSRRNQAAITEGTERRVNEQAANNYAYTIELMVNAVSDVSTSPGAPFVDCEKAYPKPTPLNWFD